MQDYGLLRLMSRNDAPRTNKLTQKYSQKSTQKVETPKIQNSFLNFCCYLIDFTASRLLALWAKCLSNHTQPLYRAI